MNDSVIEVKDFRKVYGDLAAVDSISFEVQRGEIFGLLGPNGAGKTSTRVRRGPLRLLLPFAATYGGKSS